MKTVRTRLFVQELEARELLAVLWPVFPQNAQHRLLSTYGQYQEATAGGVDFLIHFHEGVDILKPAGDPVRAMAPGVVDGKQDGSVDPRTGQRTDDGQYSSHIVVQDPGGADAGWNYKHVVPGSKPKGNQQNVGVERRWLRGDEVKVTNGEGDRLGRVALAPKELGGITVNIPTHIHLDRGAEVDPSLDNANRQRRPVDNPLDELSPANDTIKPTIGEVHFLVAEHDRLGELQQVGISRGERPREDNHYFSEKVGAHVIVGRRAPTLSENETHISDNISAEARGKLDAQTLRQQRAVQVLERIGSEKARQLLQTLARGASQAGQTRDARTALARFERR